MNDSPPRRSRLPLVLFIAAILAATTIAYWAGTRRAGIHFAHNEPDLAPLRDQLLTTAEENLSSAPLMETIVLEVDDVDKETRRIHSLVEQVQGGINAIPTEDDLPRFLLEFPASSRADLLEALKNPAAENLAENPPQTDKNAGREFLEVRLQSRE